MNTIYSTLAILPKFTPLSTTEQTQIKGGATTTTTRSILNKVPDDEKRRPRA